MFIVFITSLLSLSLVLSFAVFVRYYFNSRQTSLLRYDTGRRIDAELQFISSTKKLLKMRHGEMSSSFFGDKRVIKTFYDLPNIPVESF